MTRVRALKPAPDEINACNGVTLATGDPGRAKSAMRLVPVLVTVLGVLQLLDLHSSAQALGATEANHAINFLAQSVGVLASLVFAKLVALGAIGCMYVVWCRCPTLRREVICALVASVIAYGGVVLSNYGAAL